MNRLALAAIVSAATISSCSTPTPAPRTAISIATHGALRDMFHAGQTGPVVRLDAVLKGQGVYAVGALADLRGEVTIVHGEVFLSYPVTDSTARTERVLHTEEAATLLVSAEVADWTRVVLEEDVAFADLDERIPALARAAGLDVTEPFPFLIEGALRDIAWHVIDGRRLTGGGEGHEDHLKAAVRETRDEAEGTLVGFYSERHQGVFTHMGSRTHLHCVLHDPLGAGHLDGVTVTRAAAVLFPAAPAHDAIRMR